MKRLGGFFVAVLAAVSLVVSGFVPVFAAEPGSAAPFEAADLLSARVQASLRGHRVLVGDELRADSSTWVNPDGSLTSEVFGAPVRVRDVAGKFGWRDLDFSLVFASDGSVVARSGLLPLHISGGGSASKSVANLAGKIWTKSTKYRDIEKGSQSTKGLMGYRNGKPVQYRLPKNKGGKTSANLEQFAKEHGDYATQPRFNFHIEIVKGFLK